MMQIKIEACDLQQQQQQQQQDSSSDNPSLLMTAVSSKPKSMLVYACKQCNIYFPIRRMLELHSCQCSSSSKAVTSAQVLLASEIGERLLEEPTRKIKVDPDYDDDDDDENSWEVETLDENLPILAATTQAKRSISSSNRKDKGPKLDVVARRRLKCPYCSFKCDNASTYRSHVKRKHYECSLKQQQKQKPRQRRHVQAKTASSLVDGTSTSVSATPDEDGKIRRCPHCSFETRKKSTLYSHICRLHKTGAEQQQQLEAMATPSLQQRRRGNAKETGFDHTAYACSYCTFAAATMSSLKYHIGREHGGGESHHPVIEFPVQEFDCHQCDYKSKSRKTMQHHLKAEHQMKPNSEGMFSCRLCSYESTSKMGVQRHISIKHDRPRREQKQNSRQSTVKVFSCRETCCDYRTYNAKVLEWHIKRRHKLTDAGDDFFCNDCEFVTWTKAQLLTHIKRNHSSSSSGGGGGGSSSSNMIKEENDASVAATGAVTADGMLQCDRCDYTTKNKHVMKVHVIRKHTEAFNHTCEQCGKKYKVKADLTNHMRFQHRERPIICDVCGKECRNSNLLYLHQKFAHYKPEFECHICHRRMVSQANLDDHVFKQHEQKQNVICEECGKTFTRQSRLKIHMRTHLGLRPYTCQICGKSFARRNGLRQHLLIHTGQRPYVCDICGKDFTQKTGLISHRKSHPGSHPPLPRITIDHVLSSLPIN